MKFIFIDIQKPTRGLLLFRLAFLAILIMLSWKLIGYNYKTAEIWDHFLHLPNLIFHEAGHVIFIPFGSFITALGGTLGQLIIPIICSGTLFFKSRDPFGGFVCFWWFGQNFLDIAPYVFDAVYMKQPLVGGVYGHSMPYGVHDWNYILNESGLLSYYYEISQIIYIFGVNIILISLLGMGIVSVKHFKNIKVE